MRFSDIEIFLATLDEGNLSAAARRLGLTQPAVSARIALLEKGMNTTLLVRESRQVFPTPSGQILYDFGRRTLRDMESVLQQIQEQSHQASGPLELSGGDLSGIYLAPLLVGGFQRKHPRVQPKIELKSISGVMSDLVEHRCDVATLPFKPADLSVDAVYLCTDELRLIVPPDHPLGKEKRITPDVIEQLPLLTRHHNSIGHAHLLQALESVGVRVDRLQYVMEMGSNEALRAGVAAGLGAAFVSHWCLQSAPHQSCPRIEVEGLRILRPFHLLRNHTRPHRYVSQLFWEHVQQEETMKRLANLLPNP